MDEEARQFAPQLFADVFADLDLGATQVPH